LQVSPPKPCMHSSVIHATCPTHLILCDLITQITFGEACITFHNMLTLYGEKLLDPRPAPRLECHPLWLFATTYSIYSQLLSMSGGHVPCPQPEDAPGCGDSKILNMWDH
jgi:hypothetical protein